MIAHYHTRLVHPTDAYAAHRDVLAPFPEVSRDDARAALGVLFVADEGRAYVQSLIAPACPSRAVEIRVPPSGRFRVRATPVKRDARTGRVVLLPEPEWVSWLQAAMSRCGFVIEAEVHRHQIIRGRKGAHWIEHFAVDFWGYATTQDAEAAATGLVTGIGKGKAFGCGWIRMEGVNDYDHE
jgi:CRISPR-associated protein Cas6/Cse3/CasE subtype I-E